MTLPSSIDVVVDPRLTEVGGAPVARVLPRIARRTVGPFVFFDHFGPQTISATASFDVGPRFSGGLPVAPDPARRPTRARGADRARAVRAHRRSWEHRTSALRRLRRATIDGFVAPKHLVVIASGATPTVSDGAAGARIAVLGGPALDGARYLDWNFVASSKERLAEARADWIARRFPIIVGDEEERIPHPSEERPQ